MKQTPMKKLIEFIQTMPYTDMPLIAIKAKATELLAEERRYITDEEIDAMYPIPSSKDISECDTALTCRRAAKTMRDLIFGNSSKIPTT